MKTIGIVSHWFPFKAVSGNMVGLHKRGISFSEAQLFSGSFLGAITPREPLKKRLWHLIKELNSYLHSIWGTLQIIPILPYLPLFGNPYLFLH